MTADITPTGQRERLSNRLNAAEVTSHRYINVHEGKKGGRKNTNNHQNPDNWMDTDARGLSGNYGVHGGQGLIIIDIDDNPEHETPALNALPETFNVISPHADVGQGHRFYRVDGEQVADAIREETGGAKNAILSWGEIKYGGTYTVGPGSQLDGCDKDDCSACDEPDGGYYRIGEDREIAELPPEVIRALIRVDNLAKNKGSDTDSSGTEGGSSGSGGSYDLPQTSPDEKPLCYHNALVARENGGGNAENRRVIDQYAGILGITAGYPLSEVVEHFAEFPPASGAFDRETTRYQLKSIRDDGVNPVGVRKLQRYGLLGPDGCTDDCPIHGTGGNAEYVPVLPSTPAGAAKAATGTGESTWGWWNTDRGGGDDVITRSEGQARTAEAISHAFGRYDNVLLDALPTTGKSYGTIKAAAETGNPTSIFTLRGRKEQYGQIQQWCAEFGLSCLVLPSVTRDCPMFTGDAGDTRDERQNVRDYVRNRYGRGATGRDIHRFYEDANGHKPPCEGGAGDRCLYKAKWEHKPEDYDVVVGAPVHAHVESVTTGRTCVFDEFPGMAFATQLEGHTGRAVSELLERRGDIPFADFADLLEHRSDTERRRQGLDALRTSGQGTEADGFAVMNDPHARAEAPAAVYTILAAAEPDGEQYESGYDRAPLAGSNGDVGVFDRKNAEFTVLRKPDLRYSSGVVCLDGTPETGLWNGIIRKNLNTRQILTDGERVEYLKHALNITLVRTIDFVKNYNSSAHINSAEDGALLDGITERHGEAPALLTTQTARKEHVAYGLYETDDDGNLSHGHGRISDVGIYGNLKGSNRFSSTRLGCVIGANHYGDGPLQLWGALLGADVARDGDGKGNDLSYTERNADDERGGPIRGLGEQIHRHMTEDETLQAVLRFGRDGGGATVYVHTNSLPEWVEQQAVHADGRVIETHSTGRKQVLAALDSMGIADGEQVDSLSLSTHPDVSLSRRQVRAHLSALTSRGILERTERTRAGYQYDDGEQQAGEHGFADLPEAERAAEAVAGPEPEDSPGESGSEVAPMDYYTWSFRTPPTNHPIARSHRNAASENADTSNAGDRNRPD